MQRIDLHVMMFPSVQVQLFFPSSLLKEHLSINLSTYLAHGFGKSKHHTFQDRRLVGIFEGSVITPTSTGRFLGGCGSFGRGFAAVGSNKTIVSADRMHFECLLDALKVAERLNQALTIVGAEHRVHALTNVRAPRPRSNNCNCYST